MIPNPKNFCGGNFQDWLEVNLTDKCNGKCSWCIEKNGFHPQFRAEWWVIAEQALKSQKKNIILLGGEPTLRDGLMELIRILNAAGRKVWITTNGSKLNRDFAKYILSDITGINISIHDSDLNKNRDITGINLNEYDLRSANSYFNDNKISVRLNCNCIAGHVDSIDAIEKYIEFAKRINANKVRFAELKLDEENFVDLAKVLNYKYGLNDNPFVNGCNSDAVINDMPVNFRQMCGLQTSRREQPTNPEQALKTVLYYDGEFYNGWQIKENDVTDKELVKLLEKVAEGEITVAEAAITLSKEIEKDKEKSYKSGVSSAPSGGCCY